MNNERPMTNDEEMTKFKVTKNHIEPASFEHSDLFCHS